MNPKKSFATLVAVTALFAAPFFYAGCGAKPPAPQLAKPANATQCVEPADWMRANHMNLLKEQRDAIVREGDRNRKYRIEGCAQCHTKRAEFCDRCHDYAGAKPECFDCHYLP